MVDAELLLYGRRLNERHAIFAIGTCLGTQSSLLRVETKPIFRSRSGF